MAKKKAIKNQPKNDLNVYPEQPVTFPEIPMPAKSWQIYDFKFQAVIVGLLGLIFYCNSCFNEYAHDDGIVIVRNQYVWEGLAGLPDILTKDGYESYFRYLNTENPLTGGRYRPLSIVTFAIEQQFMGSMPEQKADSLEKEIFAKGISSQLQNKLVHDMHIRHVVNVLLYILSLVLLLYFLHIIVFSQNPLMAFITTLLFTIHPIHTEVVANVKSRDEILSLLFICLTFIYAFRYQEQKKTGNLLIAAISFFLACMSKEYALLMLVWLPLAYYLFNNLSIKKSLVATLPYVGVFLIYFAIRYSLTAPPSANVNYKSEILDNPYALATSTEKLATEIATSLNYLKLLLFPHPLSYDYSYNSITYKSFSHPLVWISLLVHVGIIGAFYPLFKKRSVICFAIALYILPLLLICNIFFDIGATMGERLIYHSSLGFCIAAAYFLVKAFEKIKPQLLGLQSLGACMAIIIVLSGYKTIQRNAEWKNEQILTEADLKTVPNSVLVISNVAASKIDKSREMKTPEERNKYLNEALELLNRAITLHPTYDAAYLNRSLVWYKLGNMQKAKADLDQLISFSPNNPELKSRYQLIASYKPVKNKDNYASPQISGVSISDLQKSLQTDSLNPDKWYELGNAYFANRQFTNAIAALKQSLKLKEDNINTINKLSASYHNNNQYDSCEYYSKKSLTLAPDNTEALNSLAGVYFARKKYIPAISLYKKAIIINPGYVEPYSNIGGCYFYLNKFDSAVHYLNKAIATDAAFYPSYQSLALVYKVMGKADSSMKYENIARKYNPSFKL